ARSGYFVSIRQMPSLAQSATSSSKPSAVRLSARKVLVASSSSTTRMVALSSYCMPPLGRRARNWALPRLLRRTDQHFVDRVVLRPGQRKRDRLGDVGGLQRLDLLAHLLHRLHDDRVALVVALQLGLDEARGATATRRT